MLITLLKLNLWIPWIPFTLLSTNRSCTLFTLSFTTEFLRLPSNDFFFHTTDFERIQHHGGASSTNHQITLSQQQNQATYQQSPVTQSFVTPIAPRSFRNATLQPENENVTRDVTLTPQDISKITSKFGTKPFSTTLLNPFDFVASPRVVRRSSPNSVTRDVSNFVSSALSKVSIFFTFLHTVGSKFANFLSNFFIYGILCM
jgi:hypothetical protein